MINNIGRHSPIRMMGIASGMDTEVLIQRAMKIQQMQLDRRIRSRTTMQWKQELHAGVRDELTNFRRTFLTALGPSGMMSSAVYNTTKANVTGSNASAVSIRTSPGSALGSLTINSVTQLAQGATATVTDVTGLGGPGLTQSTRLGDITVPVDPDEPDKGTKKIEFTPGSPGVPGTTEVTINGKKITLNSDDTIATMMSKINSSDAGVTMTYDQLKDTFRIETNETIKDGVVQSRKDETLTLKGDLFEKLGFIGADGKIKEFSAAQDAQVEINGYTITSHTNSFNFRGINITLNSTFEEGDGAVNVEVVRDSDAAFNSIKGFVDAYNSLFAKLEGLLKDSKSKSEVGYLPLTDEEKANMTEKQIADWEAIAKKGLLRSDPALQSLATNLRSSFFSTVEAAGLSPSQIGLTTGNYWGDTGGKIFINEEKLRAALEDDPEKIVNLFMSGANATESKDKGLLYRMNDLIGDYLNNSSANTLDRLDRSIKDMDMQLQRMQEKMWEEEDRLYRKYAAMETALSKLQSQGDWFSSLVEGLNK